jgi:hypothetical protein
MPPGLNADPSLATLTGWERLALELRAVLPVDALDRLWVFPVVRKEGQDFGTAILSRIDGARRRIYTARFVHTVKGKKRGQFTWSHEEVGSGPLEALDELLALVPRRSDEEEPPAPVEPLDWFHPDPGPSAADSAGAPPAAR